MRWNAWTARTMRCSREMNQVLDCNREVSEIRDFREWQSKALGYQSWADMSMETKMAGNTENVYKMLTALMNDSIPRQKKDIEGLTKFAKDNGFLDTQLLAYDIPYYSRLQREALY